MNIACLKKLAPNLHFEFYTLGPKIKKYNFSGSVELHTLRSTLWRFDVWTLSMFAHVRTLAVRLFDTLALQHFGTLTR